MAPAAAQIVALLPFALSTMHIRDVPSRAACVRMKAGTASKSKAPARASGFGAAKPKAQKKTPPVRLDPEVQAALEELEQAGSQSLRSYLNPALFEDPKTMEDISNRLKSGDVVVLRDAFRPAFAEMVYSELQAKNVAWELNEAYFEDGYHHKHHNVYDQGMWSARLNSTLGIFSHPDSTALMAELSGRDCTGDTTGAPSWYQEGDHSLPHTDWVGQRTVSYVWHLSKNWRPEWGGALYWAQHDHAVATYPASFNTLVLFSVTPRSAHFVTTVSPKHKGKRLTFNGWWQSAWMPTLEDDLEGSLSNAESRSAMTHTQVQAITDMVNDPWQNVPAERRDTLQDLRAGLMREIFPQGSRTGLEA